MPKRVEKRDARLALLKRFEPLVQQIVGGFQRRLPVNVLREDLLAAGMGGLWDAIVRCGESRSADGSFEWYVRVRVRGAILDELRAEDWLPRRARALADEREDGSAPVVIRYDDVSGFELNQALSSEDSPEGAIDARVHRRLLTEAMTTLPEREQFIVSQHYLRGAKFRDIGSVLGISEARVSQINKRIAEKLRATLSKQGIHR